MHLVIYQMRILKIIVTDRDSQEWLPGGPGMGTAKATKVEDQDS